ncbi:MAG TPA: hypothetical protein VE338_15515 [Ktedonobacterales bacterium]|nr:hypothetical protein [Ktedonobacterales bacterium]
MAARIRELEPRLMERMRAELAEVLAANVAYPAYFDFRANQLVTRPIDRGRMEEIQRFLNSANFAPIEHADIASAETRHFIERLILRYIEVNEGLRGRYVARRTPPLRALAPRLAAETQRRATGYLSGSVPDFGARRQTTSWTSVTRRERRRSDEERQRATRMLETALTQPREASASLPAAAPPRQAPASAPDPWRGLPNDVTIPVPAADYLMSASSAPAPIAPDGMPARLSEQPTGPLPTPPAAHAKPVPMRELPPDLYQLYGEYLNDMDPPAANGPAPVVAAPPPPPPAPAPGPVAKTQTPSATGARNDQLIFWQLRYQLEAYVRRAARSYGVPHQANDPATVLDELRRSGFVDESDLRIAEGIFALTDRVTAQGHATAQEYSQALMLYLLYHRSHLNI